MFYTCRLIWKSSTPNFALMLCLGASLARPNNARPESLFCHFHVHQNTSFAPQVQFIITEKYWIPSLVAKTWYKESENLTRNRVSWSDLHSVHCNHCRILCPFNEAFENWQTYNVTGVWYATVWPRFGGTTFWPPLELHISKTIRQMKKPITPLKWGRKILSKQKIKDFTSYAL